MPQHLFSSVESGERSGRYTRYTRHYAEGSTPTNGDVVTTADRVCERRPPASQASMTAATAAGITRREETSGTRVVPEVSPVDADVLRWPAPDAVMRGAPAPVPPTSGRDARRIRCRAERTMTAFPFPCVGGADGVPAADGGPPTGARPVRNIAVALIAVPLVLRRPRVKPGPARIGAPPAPGYGAAPSRSTRT